jgi:cob(I)alamin adenosyltransferase
MSICDRQGLVHIYTGSGKGKTTAAWGQALRAVGHGWQVAIVQFLKPGPSGECAAAERLQGFIVCGRTTPHDPCIDQRANTALAEESRKNFDKASELVCSGRWDMVVLDEINVALHYDFVSRDELLGMLGLRPAHVEVILTGRYAPDWLINAADVVTEMQDIKHPLTNGLGARMGIEY